MGQSPSTPANNGLNSPTSRSAWTPGYTVNNDTDKIFPSTGVTRTYNLAFTDTQCNPDGHGLVQCMLVNGVFPGPTLYADWGDNVVVNVVNNMQTNGTSIHFHGLTQQNNNIEDGVNGITECPIAPGTSKTYQWQATQHGTSWYHSHYTGQYGAGIQGPIVIDGPATANYDIDLGPLPLTDWTYNPAFTEAYINEQRALNFQGILPVDNILINGTNKDANGNGDYYRIRVTSGKTHRLRLVNTAVSAGLLFEIAGHTMTVIEQDFVPVQPFNVTQLTVAIGQRYDVLITANQPSSAYWVQADADTGCFQAVSRGGRAVLVYSDSTIQTPSTAEPSGTSVQNNCLAPATTPIWDVTAGNLADFSSSYGYLTLNEGPQVASHNGDFIDWYFNTTGIDIMWGNPTRTYIAEGNTSYPAELAVIPATPKNGWSYWVIFETPNPGTSFIPHPLHLHGHDFYLLGEGVGPFPGVNAANLNFNNPPRRDTHILRGDGQTNRGVWFAFAFQTGNPGAWLFHCHIAQHISAGFGVQFLDSVGSIPAPPQQYYDQCSSWNKYYANVNPVYRKNDSGLKKRKV